MTRIRYSLENLTLRAEGHAGAGVNGQDIVCAGISAITQSLLNALRADQEKQFIELEWEMDEKRGALSIRAEPYGGHWTATKAYFRMAEAGLKAIEENYPGHLEMKEETEDGNV